jgi:hypothetical protein
VVRFNVRLPVLTVPVRLLLVIVTDVSVVEAVDHESVVVVFVRELAAYVTEVPPTV